VLNFRQYFWARLHPPLKKVQDGEMWRLAGAVGAAFDGVRAALMETRKLWSAPTASGFALDLIGRARGIRRLSGEADAAYLKRLASAFNLYQLGGTPGGVLLAMVGLGFEDVEYQEGPAGPKYDGTYKYDGTVQYAVLMNWAEFLIKVVLPDGIEMDATTWANFRRSIAKWKAAHAKLLQLVVKHDLADEATASDESMDLVLGLSMDDSAQAIAKYDGTYRHDGTIAYDGNSDELEVTVHVH